MWHRLRPRVLDVYRGGRGPERTTKGRPLGGTEFRSDNPKSGAPVGVLGPQVDKREVGEGGRETGPSERWVGGVYVEGGRTVGVRLLRDSGVGTQVSPWTPWWKGIRTHSPRTPRPLRTTTVLFPFLWGHAPLVSGIVATKGPFSFGSTFRTLPHLCHVV